MSRAKIDESRFLNTAQVAALTGHHLRTVQRWCESGAIPAWRGVKKGQWLISRTALANRHAFLEAEMAAERDDGDRHDLGGW